MGKHEYYSIEQALEDLKNGKVILVTDDPDRENEGDMICAAEFATRENINFMASVAKGLICTPMSIEVADRLGLPPMVSEIQTTITRHLQYLLITLIQQQVFQQRKEHLQWLNVQILPLSQQILEDRIRFPLL